MDDAPTAPQIRPNNAATPPTQADQIHFIHALLAVLDVLGLYKISNKGLEGCSGVFCNWCSRIVASCRPPIVCRVPCKNPMILSLTSRVP